MLTIWDVVNEILVTRTNRQQANRLFKNFTLSNDNKKSNRIDINEKAIIQNDYLLVNTALECIRNENSIPTLDIEELNPKKCSEIVELLCNNMKIFQKKHGSIKEEYCCEKGWNKVISEKCLQKSVCFTLNQYLNFFLIKDQLWLFVGRIDGYDLTEKLVMTLLTMYVIARHNDGFNPTRLGIFSIYSGTEWDIDVNSLSHRTYESVAAKYIGYDMSDNVFWANAEGESINRIKEIYEHFDLYSDRCCVFPKNQQEIQAAKSISRHYQGLFNALAGEDHNYVKKVDIPSAMSYEIAPVSQSLPAEAEQYVHEVSFRKSLSIGSIAIYHISDIHLEWHLKDINNQDEINELVSKLYPIDLESRIKKGKTDFIVLFCGDIADSIDLSKRFFTSFVNRWHTLRPSDNTMLPVVCVLGNHEYSEFNSIHEADEAYEKMLKHIGIMLLNNKACNVTLGQFRRARIQVVGGAGFAKYDKKYNCETIIGPKKLTRKEEIEESERFLELYEKAQKESINLGTPLIVVTHYPLNAWMPDYKKNIRKDSLYFNGHNHRNTVYLENNYHLYANNQIGYKSRKQIVLKKVLTGTITNPFIQYGDGAYEISSDKYLQFLQYCGENTDNIKLIDMKLKKNNACLYMIKRYGLYGFFVISDVETFICVGARIKHISNYTEIAYFYKNFAYMVNTYLSGLLPYRQYEEKISKALKSLGFDGTIHGAIVDMDFYNHIMINLDGTLSIYYSTVFGLARNYDSFEEYLLESENEKALEQFRAKKQNELSILNIRDGCHIDNEQVPVDTSKFSMYGFSRKVRNLERLFTCNILREWDDSYAKEKMLA